MLLGERVIVGAVVPFSNNAVFKKKPSARLMKLGGAGFVILSELSF